MVVWLEWGRGSVGMWLTGPETLEDFGRGGNSVSMSCRTSFCLLGSVEVRAGVDLGASSLGEP